MKYFTVGETEAQIVKPHSQQVTESGFKMMPSYWTAPGPQLLSVLYPNSVSIPGTTDPAYILSRLLATSPV